MLRNGFEGKIDAFVFKPHLERLKNWPDCQYFRDHPNIKIINFEYPRKNNHGSISLVDKGWEEISLPDMDKYDILWSDNILDVLQKRSDAIITGSFLWHEVFENSKYSGGLRNFIDYQKNLIKKHKPIMVGNEFFATPEVRKTTRFIPVGFYRYETFLREKKTSNILYASGLGGEEEEMFKTDLEKIINRNLRPPSKLFVEPRLLPSSYPGWMQRANFSGEMFHSCMAVCIRPGFGTISDSIVNRNQIFAFSSEDSFEMVHNCNILQKMSLGHRCKSPFEAYQKAISYVSDKKKVKEHIMRTAHVRTDGVYATASIILSNGAID
tara:strand:+ start:26156 stop:27127 length:972 start_codon:yes stop_codon:yes gene_type:complete